MAVGKGHVVLCVDDEAVGLKVRRILLERAGYEPRAAGRLAVRHDVDLHTAIDLLERGCPQDLALKILL